MAGRCGNGEALRASGGAWTLRKARARRPRERKDEERRFFGAAKAAPHKAAIVGHARRGENRGEVPRRRGKGGRAFVGMTAETEARDKGNSKGSHPSQTARRMGHPQRRGMAGDVKVARRNLSS